jgi:hypothetical protein
MRRTIIVQGARFRLVPAAGEENQWIVHSGEGPIGILKRVADSYEAWVPSRASKDRRNLLRLVRDTLRRESGQAIATSESPIPDGDADDGCEEPY